MLHAPYIKAAIKACPVVSLVPHPSQPLIIMATAINSLIRTICLLLLCNLRPEGTRGIYLIFYIEQKKKLFSSIIQLLTYTTKSKDDLMIKNSGKLSLYFFSFSSFSFYNTFLAGYTKRVLKIRNTLSASIIQLFEYNT